MIKKKRKYQTKQEINFKIILALIIIIFTITIGYAALNSSINITGEANAVIFGQLFIEEVNLTDSNEASNANLPDYSLTTLKTDVSFENNQYAYITYQVKITNATNNIKKYTGETFNVPSDTSNIINYELTDGIAINEYLLPGESTTFTLNYKYRVTPTKGTYNLEMIFNFDDIGKLYATNNTHNVDLKNNNLVPLNLEITNKYDTPINYNFNLSNEKFVLTDSNGNPLTDLTINANIIENITIYIKKKDDTTYYSENHTTDLLLTHDNIYINVDTLEIQTDITGTDDTTPPQIGSVLISINPNNPEVGTFDINWTRIDTDGSPVIKYFIKLYTSDGTLIKTVNTNGNTTTYHFTNMTPNTYYALVYGEDEAGNSGESACSTATNTTTDCRRSDDTEIRWIRTVTYKLTNVGHTGPDTVNLGNELEVTLTLDTGYNYTTNPAITSGGVALVEGTDYTLDSTTGKIVIPKVTGDIVITAEATLTGCLAEGTKILMADGTYKLIENIGYDDLLLVYDHEKGKFVPEYPIWIEQKDTASNYQITTFSDGTSLKTIDRHAVFSTLDNRYIDIVDNKSLKIGTKIKKVRKLNNKYEFYDVTVTDIKKINEPINYYDVVSTRYYNIISNDVLTSDGRTVLSNVYEFKENLMWSNRRLEALQNNTFFDYKDFSYVPYYLFHGLRAQDGAVLIKYNYMKLNEFANVFKDLLLNNEMILPPIKNNKNNRLWMVTTSDDIINKNNKQDYLYLENSKYILKEPLNKKNFVKWYCTSDGNYYNPNDEIIVYHGTHFIAIYK